MTKWLKVEQYKKIYSFIGAQAALYLALVVFAGLLVFGAELGFAF